VTNSGRRAEAVFLDKTDYRAFLGLLREMAESGDLRVAAYCLTPSHYHLFVQTPAANLARCMRRLNGVYTQRFNRRHQCDGQLFRGRYKAILVDADSYALQLVRYIHRDPVRAGISVSPEDYTWSSHNGYLSRAKKWKWLYKEFALSMLAGKNQDKLKPYRYFMSMEDSEEFVAIYQHKRWPLILGAEHFVNRIKEKYFALHSDRETSQSRDLAPETERIKREVSDYYRVDEHKLLASRRGVTNEPRNVAIYLTRRLRGESLKEIGAPFNLRKYSSVSSVIARVNAAMKSDRAMSDRVAEILSRLKKSQEKT